MRTLLFSKVAPSEAHLDRIYRNDRGLLDAPDRSDTALVLRVVWRVLILGAFVLLTFPPCFGRMGGGLDSSWAIGLNEAVNRHMIFGRDVVFTYGPLGFVTIPVNLGSNMVHALVFRLGLHLFWWTSVGLLLFSNSGVLGFVSLRRRVLLERHLLRPELGRQLSAHRCVQSGDNRPIWYSATSIEGRSGVYPRQSSRQPRSWRNSTSAWHVPARSWSGQSSNCSASQSPRMIGRLGLVVLTYVGVTGSDCFESTAGRSTLLVIS